MDYCGIFSYSNVREEIFRKKVLVINTHHFFFDPIFIEICFHYFSFLLSHLSLSSYACFFFAFLSLFLFNSLQNKVHFNIQYFPNERERKKHKEAQCKVSVKPELSSTKR